MIFSRIVVSLKNSASLKYHYECWYSVILHYIIHILDICILHERGCYCAYFDSYVESDRAGKRLIRLKKKKICVSKLPPAFVFLCAFDFAKFRLSFFFFLKLLFFFIFTTKNKSLLFWKNLSTWELKNV